MISLRYSGSLGDLTDADRRALLDRGGATDPAVSDAVRRITGDVRARGDAALLDLSRRFDPATPAALEVPREEWESALATLPKDLRRAMKRGARNIATVHRANMPRPLTVEPEPGVIVERRPDPLQRVGVYVPGGRAAYPSSVLMAAVPAYVAGVDEVVLCSPPSEGGLPAATVLAAAAVAGVDRVFAVGGAGAIAAMALGTETIPRVDRVVGPGNAFVAEAKLQLVGAVGIDCPAGPSELLVIADDSAEPPVVAREVIAQAEHDPLASVVVLCIGDETAPDVMRALEDLICGQLRAPIIRAALRGQGAVLTVESIECAIDFASRHAPEHLMIIARDAERIADSTRNAGAIFVGSTSSVAFGDYLLGSNHVLPTGGLARSYSGLSVQDFMRWTTVQRVNRAAAAALAADASLFAEAEGLAGHASAALAWSRS